MANEETKNTSVAPAAATRVEVIEDIARITSRAQMLEEATKELLSIVSRFPGSSSECVANAAQMLDRGFVSMNQAIFRSVLAYPREQAEKPKQAASVPKVKTKKPE